LECRQLKVKGFEGWYKFNNTEIPTFEMYCKDDNNYILILDGNRLGWLEQYRPINEGESESYIKDIFYINIQSYSENLSLLEEFILKPPDWLKEKGDKKQQEEYLKEHVLISIYERVEFRRNKNIKVL
jgi:hypothetical protein